LINLFPLLIFLKRFLVFMWNVKIE
jgi:hypothetical protein